MRRNSGKPSSDLRAEFTQDGDRVSSDKVTGSAVRRAAPPHRGLLRTAKSRGTNLGFFGGNNWTRTSDPLLVRQVL